MDETQGKEIVGCVCLQIVCVIISFGDNNEAFRLSPPSPHGDHKSKRRPTSDRVDVDTSPALHTQRIAILYMNDALVLVFNSSRLSLGVILFCFIFFSVFSSSTGDDKTDESFFLNAFESQPSSLSYSLLSGISTIREFQFRKLLRSAKCIRAIPGRRVRVGVFSLNKSM